MPKLTAIAQRVRRAQINATGKQVTLGNDNPRYTAESGIAINEAVTLGRVVGVFKRV